MGELCLRKAQAGSPSSFVRLRFACRVAGAPPPAPPCAFASLGFLWLGLAVRSPVGVGLGLAVGSMPFAESWILVGDTLYLVTRIHGSPNPTSTITHDSADLAGPSLAHP
jgi:hypothetical protein